MAKPLAFRTPQAHWHTLVCALTAVVGSAGGLALASDIEFVVDRADGAIYIRNTADTTQFFDGYTIQVIEDVNDAALIVSGWTPIAGNYDASGDGSVDSTNDWFIPNQPSANSVEEVSPTENSGSLAPGQIVSLGLLFDTSFFEGLKVETSSGVVVTPQPLAFFRDLEADYDADLDVDADDYGIFSTTFGSTVDLRADGNNDGIIDAADYTVWRDSPSLSLASASLIADLPASLGTAIPEPAAATMAVFALLTLSSSRRRLRRAVS